MAVKILNLTNYKLISKFIFGRKFCSSVDRINPNVEACLNEQVNSELFASYSYLAMASFFGRQFIGLSGCQKFCLKQVDEEHEHGQKIINFVNGRGGCVALQPIEPPKTQEWPNPVCVFKEALELEISISKKLLHLHKISVECGDLLTCNFIEETFFEEQRLSMDEIARYVTLLERMGGDGLGVQLFDQLLLKECTSKK